MLKNIFLCLPLLTFCNKIMSFGTCGMVWGKGWRQVRTLGGETQRERGLIFCSDIRNKISQKVWNIDIVKKELCKRCPEIYTYENGEKLFFVMLPQKCIKDHTYNYNNVKNYLRCNVKLKNQQKMLYLICLQCRQKFKPVH